MLYSRKREGVPTGVRREGDTMSHVLHISDDIYKRLATIASQQGEQPDALAETWLRERVSEEQAEATPCSVAWLKGLEGAIEEAKAGEGRFVGSTTDLLRIVEGKMPDAPEKRA